MSEVSGKAVIDEAERFVRSLAATGDLASRRTRRRLAHAIAELGRIRQVFSADETAEAAELPRVRKGGMAGLLAPGQNPGYDAPIPEDMDDDVEREQSPQYVETASQRMTRELISALPDIVRTLVGKTQADGMRAAAARAEALASLSAQVQFAATSGDAERAAVLREEMKRLAEAGPPPPVLADPAAALAVVGGAAAGLELSESGVLSSAGAGG